MKNLSSKKSKKAQIGHAITWFYKFFILVLVIGGIVAIVVGHYSRQFDIRDIEAAIIARKIMREVAPNGLVKEFNKEAIKQELNLDEEEFYLNLSLDEKTIIFGDPSILTLCQLKERKVKQKYPPACLRERYYVLDGNESKQLDIFIGIRKVEKNT